MGRSSTTFKPGVSGNVKGRPRGIIDRRQRLQKALSIDSETLLAALVAKALNEGDVQAHALLINRYMPALKPESAPIRFALNVLGTMTEQITQVLEAVSQGQVSIEEAQQIANVIRTLAEARSIEGGGAAEDRRVDLFKDFAVALGALEKGREIGVAPSEPTEDAPSADDPPAADPVCTVGLPPPPEPLPWEPGASTPPWLRK